MPGTYKLRIRAGSVKGSDPNRHFIQIGHPQRRNRVPAGFEGKPISGHQVTGTTENPKIIETTVEIGADTPREFGIQERQPEDEIYIVRSSSVSRRRTAMATRRRSGSTGLNWKVPCNADNAVSGPQSLQTIAMEPKSPNRNGRGTFSSASASNRFSSGSAGFQVHRSTVGLVQNQTNCRRTVRRRDSHAPQRHSCLSRVPLPARTE